MQRIHKAKCDYGYNDYYNFYKKKYNKVNRKIYSSIIKDYSKEVIKLILNEYLEYKIPFINIEIIIKKEKRKPKIVNGKLINNVPIDWKATLNLWNNNEEAKSKKIRVRMNNSHTSNFVFKIITRKFKSKMKNRTYYTFKPCRYFQRELAKRIKDPNKDKFDGFLLY